MTEELVHNFSRLASSLERETRVLRNISNLRALLDTEHGPDPAVLGQLEDIERAVELLEEHLDDFEDHLAKEEHCLQAMKVSRLWRNSAVTSGGRVNEESCVSDGGLLGWETGMCACADRVCAGAVRACSVPERRDPGDQREHPVQHSTR